MEISLATLWTTQSLLRLREGRRFCRRSRRGLRCFFTSCILHLYVVNTLQHRRPSKIPGLATSQVRLEL